MELLVTISPMKFSKLLSPNCVQVNHLNVTSGHRKKKSLKSLITKEMQF